MIIGIILRIESYSCHFILLHILTNEILETIILIWWWPLLQNFFGFSFCFWCFKHHGLASSFLLQRGLWESWQSVFTSIKGGIRSTAWRGPFFISLARLWCSVMGMKEGTVPRTLVKVIYLAYYFSPTNKRGLPWWLRR